MHGGRTVHPCGQHATTKHATLSLSHSHSLSFSLPLSLSMYREQGNGAMRYRYMSHTHSTTTCLAWCKCSADNTNRDMLSMPRRPCMEAAHHLRVTCWYTDTATCMQYGHRRHCNVMYCANLNVLIIVKVDARPLLPQPRRLNRRLLTQLATERRSGEERRG